MIDDIKYGVRVLPVIACTGRHGTKGLPFPSLNCMLFVFNLFWESRFPSFFSIPLTTAPINIILRAWFGKEMTCFLSWVGWLKSLISFSVKIHRRVLSFQSIWSSLCKGWWRVLQSPIHWQTSVKCLYNKIYHFSKIAEIQEEKANLNFSSTLHKEHFINLRHSLYKRYLDWQEEAVVHLEG